MNVGADALELKDLNADVNMARLLRAGNNDSERLVMAFQAQASALSASSDVKR